MLKLKGKKVKKFERWAKSIGARYDKKEIYLKGDSIVLRGTFDCSDNKLTEIEIPENFIIVGRFDCSHNLLKQLIIPNTFVANNGFNCDYNKLSELIIPDNFILNRWFSCEHNKLIKLVIGKNFVLNGRFNCHGNLLKSISTNSKPIIKDGFVSDKYLGVITELPEYSSLREENHMMGHYTHYDGVLRPRISTKEIDKYIIHYSGFDYLAVCGANSAHGETPRQAIAELNFKERAGGLSWVSKDINKKYNHDELYAIFKTITDSCVDGMQDWMLHNKEFIRKAEKEGASIKELIRCLQKSKYSHQEFDKHYAIDKKIFFEFFNGSDS